MSIKKARSIGNTVVLALFVLLSMFSLFSDDILSKIPFSRAYVLAIITALIFFIPAMVLKADDGRKGGAFFRLKRFKLKWMPLTFSAAITATIGGIALNALSVNLLPDEMKSLSLNPIANVSFDDPTSAILALIVIPAIFEELFFRGAYLSSFGKDKRPVIIFVGAICFAIMHSTPYSFFATFFAGCIYGTLVFVLDSVYPAMIAHLINNIITCFAFYFRENIAHAGLGNYITFGAILIFLISIYISLRDVEQFIKIRPQSPSTVSERIESQKGKFKIVDLPFLILISLWVIKLCLKIGGIWS